MKHAFEPHAVCYITRRTDKDRRLHTYIVVAVVIACLIITPLALA